MRRRLFRFTPCVLSGILAAFSPAAAKAQTYTWADQFGGNFNNNFTWTAPFPYTNTVPASSNALTLDFSIFDGLNYTAANNITGGLTLNQLTFSSYSAAASGTVTISGNALTFDAPVPGSGTASAAISQNGQGTIAISAAVNFGTTNSTMLMDFNGTGTGTVSITGAITGTATDEILINTNPLATTSLSGANTTFLGTTVLQQGILSIGNVSALGSTGASNTLTINGNNTILNFAASGTVPTYINIATGNLNITASTTTQVTLSGVISGSGNVVIDSGVIELTNGSNSFTGGVDIYGGKLLVNANVPQVGSGNTVIGAGLAGIQIGRSYGTGALLATSTLFLDAGGGYLVYSGARSGAELYFGAGITSFGAPITVNQGGELVSLYNGAGAVVTFTPSASITLNRDLVVWSGTGLVLSGNISGPGGLNFVLDPVTLSGTNTYSGPTQIENDVITLGSSSPLGTGPVIVHSSGVTFTTTSGLGTLTLNNPIYASAVVSIGTGSGTGGVSAYSTEFTGTNSITLTQPLSGAGSIIPYFSSLLGATLTLQAPLNTIGALFSPSTAPTGTTTLAIGTNTLNAGFSNYSINLGYGFYGNFTGSPGSVFGKYGINAIQLSGTVSVDQFVAQEGSLQLISITTPITSNGTFSGSQITINTGGTFTVDNTNAAISNRLSATPALNLNAGALTYLGNATSTTGVSESVGVLNLTGFGSITITDSADGPTSFTFASLNRVVQGGGTLLIRGVGMGATQGANASNVYFTTNPTTYGGGGAAGTGQISILPYAVGGLTITDVGSTFDTYSPTTGVRPLVLATEYVAYTGSNGMYDNVRQAGAPTAVLVGQTINSLILDNTGTTAGMLVTGSGTLSIGNSAPQAGFLLAATGSTTEPTQVNGFSSINFNTSEAIIFVTNASALGARIDSPITATGGLTKSGGGILFLTANNNAAGLTGPIVIAGGTLYETNDNQLGVSSNTVTLAGGVLQYAAGSGTFPRTLFLGPSGGTLNVVGGQTLTVSNILDIPGENAGSFIKDGGGTLILTGINAIGDGVLGGRIAINRGILSVANSSVLGSVPYITFDNGAVLGPTLQITGTGATTFNQSIVFSGQQGAYIDVPNPSSTVTWAGNIMGGSAIGSYTTVAGEFAKIGQGTLILTNTDPFNGPMTVVAGGLTFAGNGSALNTIGTAATTSSATGTYVTAGNLVAFGAVLTLDDTGTNLLDRLSQSQALRLQNGSFVLLGNASAASSATVGDLVLESGSFNTVTINPGAGQYASFGFSDLAVANGATATQTGASAIVLMRGPNLGAIPINGTTTAGIVTSGGSQSFTGLALVGGGGADGTTNISIVPGVFGDFSATGTGISFVTFESPTSLATGYRPLHTSEYGTTINSNSGFFTASTQNVLLNSSVALSGQASINALNLGAGAGLTGTGTLTVTSGMFLTQSLAQGGSANATISNGAIVVGLSYSGVQTTGPASTAYFLINNNLTLNANLYTVSANTYGLILGGTGTLTLAAPTAIAGGISVAGGTLSIASTGNINPAATFAVLSGATLELNGNNLTVGNLIGGTQSALMTSVPYGGGTVDITGATFTFGYNNGGGNWYGNISGTGGNLVRSTTTSTGGTTYIMTAQTYTGTTTIFAGNLTLWGYLGQLSNTSSVNVNGGTLALNYYEMQGTPGFDTSPRIPTAVPFSLAGSLNINANPNALTSVSLGLTTTGVNFQGGSTVTLTNGNTGFSQITPIELTLGDPTSGVITRTNFATVFFRGPNLGGVSPYAPINPATNPVATGVYAGSANIFFTTAPTASLVGGGGSAGSTNISIIPWAYGDISGTTNGTSFVTYDPNGGIRPLNNTAALGEVEYLASTALTIGTSSTNNVRISGATAIAVSSATTINSLVLAGTTAAAVTGASTLTITSGAMLDATTTALTLTPTAIMAGTGGTSELVINTITGAAMTITGTTLTATSLTKGGPGTLTLSTGTTGAFSGGVAITNGTLAVSTEAQLGLTTGANFGRILFAGPYDVPTLTVTTLTTLANDIAIPVGSGTISNAAALTLNGSSGSTNSAISGSGTLIKLGAGVLTIANNNNAGTNGFTGQIRVDAGTLSFTSDNNLGSGGDFIFNGGGVTLLGSWTTSRNIYFNAAATIAMGTNNIYFNGNVSGTTTGAMTLTGTGSTMVLSGNNSFGASLSVGTGVTLEATSNTALGLFTQGVAVAGGTLELGVNTPTVGLLIGPKPITMTTAGSTLYSLSGNNSMMGSVTLSAAGTFSVNTGSTLTLYGTVTQAANAITVTGSGTLILAAPLGNSYTVAGGTMTVSGATTLLANNQTGTAAGAVTVGGTGGGTIGGTGSVNSLTIAAGGAIFNGTAPTTLTVNVSGAAGVTFSSTPTFNVSINNASGAAGTTSLLQVPNNNGFPIALPANVTINVFGLTAANVPGVVPNFNNTIASDYFFFNSSSGFSNYGSTTFTVNAANFSNNNSLGAGNFFVSEIVNTNGSTSLILNFTPTPEPASILLIGSALLGIAGMRRNRKRVASI